MAQPATKTPDAAKRLPCCCTVVMPGMASRCAVEDEYEVLLRCTNCGRIWEMLSDRCELA